MRYTVYVLRCKTANHFYVGITRNFKSRLKQHRRGQGAAFTGKHGVRKVISRRKVRGERRAKRMEKELTAEYIRRYGKGNVAGAAHTSSVTVGRRPAPATRKRKRKRRWGRKR